MSSASWGASDGLESPKSHELMSASVVSPLTPLDPNKVEPASGKKKRLQKSKDFDVSRWLTKHGLEDYSQAFVDQGIVSRGQLLELSGRDLERLGFATIKAQNKMLHALTQLERGDVSGDDTAGETISLAHAADEGALTYQQRLEAALDSTLVMVLTIALIAADITLFIVSSAQNFDSQNGPLVRAIDVLGLLINILFFAEAALRLLVSPAKWIRDMYVIFDGLISTVALVFQILSDLNVDLGFAELVLLLRVLRVVRVVLRLVRYARKVRQYLDKRLITSGSALEEALLILKSLKELRMVHGEALKQINHVMRLLSVDDVLAKRKHKKRAEEEVVRVLEAEAKLVALLPDAKEKLKLLDLEGVPNVLAAMESWEFDAFALDRASRGHALFVLGAAVFRKQDLVSSQWFPAYANFLHAIEEMYPPNPFHSALHAAQVLQAVYYVLYTAGAAAKFKLSKVEQLACLISAVISDVGHPGVSSRFLVRTGMPLAIMYNDAEVLENFHLATAFGLAKQADFNIFGHLRPADQQLFRKVMIQCVTATAHEAHERLSNRLTAKVTALGSDAYVDSPGVDVCEQLIHACNLNDLARERPIAIRWSMRAIQERRDQWALEEYVNIATRYENPLTWQSFRMTESQLYWGAFLQAFIDDADQRTQLEGLFRGHLDYWKEWSGDDDELVSAEERAQFAPVSAPADRIKALRGLLPQALDHWNGLALLEVRVEEARFLPATRMGSRRDTRTRLVLDCAPASRVVGTAQQLGTTTTKRDCLDPIWQEDFSFVVGQDLTAVNLQALVLDKFDECLGAASISFEGMADGEATSWLYLCKKGRGAKDNDISAKGCLLVRMVLKRDVSNEFLTKLFGPGADPSAQYKAERAARLDEWSHRALQRPRERGPALRVFTGTWNMNMANPGEGLQKWLKPGMDIYAIGTQENTCLQFRKLVSKVLGPAFLHTASTEINYQVGTRKIKTRIVAFAHKDLCPFITRVVTNSQVTGVGGVIGNKGGQVVMFMVRGISLCFVNAHLAAHQSKVKERDADVMKIISKALVAVTGASKDGNDVKVSLDCAFDHAFWMGDLNYRVDFQDNPKTPSAEQLAELKAIIDTKQYDTLLASDQLISERAKGNVLFGWQEGKVQFAPTFKFRAGTSDYNKKRLPAYCDRVLWRSQAAWADSISQKEYDSVPAVVSSDHKPVFAVFTVDAPDPAPRWDVRGEARSLTFSHLKVQYGAENDALATAHYGQEAGALASLHSAPASVALVDEPKPTGDLTPELILLSPVFKGILREHLASSDSVWDSKLHLSAQQQAGALMFESAAPIHALLLANSKHGLSENYIFAVLNHKNQRVANAAIPLTEELHQRFSVALTLGGVQVGTIEGELHLNAASQVMSSSPAPKSSSALDVDDDEGDFTLGTSESGVDWNNSTAEIKPLSGELQDLVEADAEDSDHDDE